MKSSIIVLILLFFNSYSYAHYSLKQHSIVHYYPSLEKKFLYSKCKMDIIEQKNCKTDDKDIENDTSK